MTPYQLSLYVQDYNEWTKQEQEDKLVLTYLGAYWQRVKRLPNLKKILNQSVPPKKMTPEEMLAQVKKLNAALGGEVKVNGKD